VTPDEIKLGCRLLEHLRASARNRDVNKFNVIGKSTKGEFEIWLGKDMSPDDKQTLIWIWDELKRARLINATGTDLVNPEDWVRASSRGLTISESEFDALFSEATSEHKRAGKLIDAVTGILQRAELDVDLAELANQEGDELPVGFLMIDLDHFKAFNDTYGHATGDEVLNKVAQIIARVVQGKGEAYRYGGEEISVILRNHTLAEATAAAERVRNEIESARIDSLPECRVTASLGVAAIPETSEISKDMVADADRALYEAKRTGRNRVCFATKQTSGAPVRHTVTPKLEGDLNVWVGLQSGNRLWYLLNVENQTDVELRVERVSIEHDDVALTEPAFPKDGENWLVTAKGRLVIGWYPQTNPGDSLVRLFPNEGIQFSSWINVVLSIAIGAERYKYRQKLAVKVFATNGEVKQLAG
jgi:diguanylate cyclase (GGDEF)-like protein